MALSLLRWRSHLSFTANRLARIEQIGSVPRPAFLEIPGKNRQPGVARAHAVRPATTSSHDVVVQNGTRHAWRNKNDKPVKIAFVLIGAKKS
jgi:hypothetical protein